MSEGQRLKFEKGKYEEECVCVCLIGVIVKEWARNRHTFTERNSDQSQRVCKKQAVPSQRESKQTNEQSPGEQC